MKIKFFIIQHRHNPELFIDRSGYVKNWPLVFAAAEHANEIIEKLKELPCFVASDWIVARGGMTIGDIP